MIGEPSVGIPAAKAVPDFKPITVPVLNTTITDGSVLTQLILSELLSVVNSVVNSVVSPTAISILGIATSGSGSSSGGFICKL
nr:hypothetical protein [Blautia faecis]